MPDKFNDKINWPSIARNVAEHAVLKGEAEWAAYCRCLAVTDTKNGNKISFDYSKFLRTGDFVPAKTAVVILLQNMPNQSVKKSKNNEKTDDLVGTCIVMSRRPTPMETAMAAARFAGGGLQCLIYYSDGWHVIAIGQKGEIDFVPICSDWYSGRSRDTRAVEPNTDPIMDPYGSDSIWTSNVPLAADSFKSLTGDKMHKACMALAWSVAYQGVGKGIGHPIATVLLDTQTNDIIGWGHNALDSKLQNQTLHGEISALQSFANGTDASKWIVYTTLRPCRMCAGMIKTLLDPNNNRVEPICYYSLSDPGIGTTALGDNKTMVGQLEKILNPAESLVFFLGQDNRKVTDYLRSTDGLRSWSDLVEQYKDSFWPEDDDNFYVNFRLQVNRTINSFLRDHTLPAKSTA